MYVEDYFDLWHLQRLWHLWHLQHTYNLMKSPKFQLSKTFFGLKICWILRKLWAKTCLYVKDIEDVKYYEELIKGYVWLDQRLWNYSTVLSCQRCQKMWNISIKDQRLFSYSHLQCLRHTLLWSFVLTILTNPLIYTQQTRWQWWQWVASSLSNSK